MSTLLIGGNGLIGTRLSAYLADHGEEVFSYSLHSPSQKHPGVHYIQGDVTDYGTLNMLLKQNHIDRIIHNAGVSHPKMFRDNPYKIYRTNEIETLALENVNLDVEKGEFVSIMGPSGCGKSTLLNIMGLLDAPSSGKIEINGTSVENMKDKELAAFRNKTLGFVFQSFHLINSLNVIDNVELPLLYRKMPAKERTRLAKEVLERVGLSHRMRHMPTQLSGGQCQRVAIARAIVGNPEIILADEPTGNLDSKMGAEVMELLHKLNKEDGRTIVMVTHNEEQAKQTSRTIRFFDGRQVM